MLIAALIIAAVESIISTRVLQRRTDKVPRRCGNVQPTDAAAHEFSHTRRGVFTFPGSLMRRCTHACGVVRSRARRDRERDLLVSASAVREHMSRVVWLVPMKSWSLTPRLVLPLISPGYQPPFVMSTRARTVEAKGKGQHRGHGVGTTGVGHSAIIRLNSARENFPYFSPMSVPFRYA